MGEGILTADQVILLGKQIEDALLHGVTPRQLDKGRAADALDPSGVGAVFDSVEPPILRAITGLAPGSQTVLIPNVAEPLQIDKIQWGTNSGSRQMAFAVIDVNALGDLNKFTNLFTGSPDISQYFDVDVTPVANETRELTYLPNEIVIPKNKGLIAYNPTAAGSLNVFWIVRTSR